MTNPCNDFNECNDINSPQPGWPTSASPNCNPENDLNLDWMKDYGYQKTGFGSQNICDPMRTGEIVNTNPEDKNWNYIYHYSQNIRGTNEGMMDLFRNINVIDDNAKVHRVPIIFGTQEKAVAIMMADNVRKDNTLVVDRIKLPIMSLSNVDIQPAPGRYCYNQAIDYMRGPDGLPGAFYKERRDRDVVFGKAKPIPVDISYTLTVWTMYIEDNNQIIEQIVPKIFPRAYIKVRGISWEVSTRLDSMGTNIDNEPGDQNIRFIKHDFNMTTESYISLPIIRRKSVLSTKIDLVDGLQDEDITEVLKKLEETVKGLEC